MARDGPFADFTDGEYLTTLRLKGENLPNFAIRERSTANCTSMNRPPTHFTSDSISPAKGATFLKYGKTQSNPRYYNNRCLFFNFPFRKIASVYITAASKGIRYSFR